MRTYRDEVERQHGSNKLSASEIRAQKCERSRTRNEARKTERTKEHQERKAHWQSLSFDEKMTELDKRPGLCHKQRMKLLAKQTIVN